MNIVDVLIIILALSAALRGRDLGFVRQFFSGAGFFIGLYSGALLQPHVVAAAHSDTARLLLTILTTLGVGLLGLALGEYAGIKLKDRLRFVWVNSADRILGLFAGALSILLVIWLAAAIMVSFPAPSLQNGINNSVILQRLNQLLPSAPNIVASLGHLIDPNGFPQVFVGDHPEPPSNYTPPSLGDMQAAVDKDRASVVKVEGQGCGGIVQGSGFVVGNRLVATNAHVVAGIKRPTVLDGHGSHAASVIWFDPDLDFAVLRVNNLAGSPLVFTDSHITHGTPAVVMGYPGGGNFEADPAVILNQFTALGRNIYNRSNTERDVYELGARVVQGNSGGPLVLKDGSVVGVVFAESTTYQNVGYALANHQVEQAIDQAQARNQTTSTGSCT
jgi:S1-C subfamily serine protease